MDKKSFLKYKFCVSGAAETGSCKEGALESAKEVGRQIVKHNGTLVTGATSGIPYWSAIGAKEAKGTVIGFSPASSEKGHIKKYRLPTDYHDVVVYTGFGYSGRNLILTRASDAVIIICGRIGTLNEFTVAFEDNKPIGVLTGSGGTADFIEEIISRSHRGPGKIVYHSDPKVLIEELIKLVKKEKLVTVK